MRIIIPMAGRGTRLRPHTLTVPKPLLPIAGKPIVHRLVEDIVKVVDTPVEEIAFIIGSDFGDKVEAQLRQIAEQVGAQASIVYQEEKLGTAHAILCAQASLEGRVIVAFADTLFKADFTLDGDADGVIWVQEVENPAAYGVVKYDAQHVITDFVEKPAEFVSNLAIIGIYYFKDGAYLRRELQYLIDNDLKDRGEYQITNALENMKNKGTRFRTGQVEEWLDCGNKDVTIQTHQRYLEFIKDQPLISPTAQTENTVLIPPVYLGKEVKVRNAVVGPYVSIGDGCVIEDSVIKNSIIQENTEIKNAIFANSMVGNHVRFEGSVKDLSIGDYNQWRD
ncbi:MAG: sugar phosphate nucleotidyltransferase [Microscillaceae bacterium]